MNILVSSVPRGTHDNVYGLFVRYFLFITLLSYWPRWRLKSPASRSFTQSFIQTQIKENIKAPRHWPLCGEFTGTGEFPAQRASYAKNVSIWRRHRVIKYTNHEIKQVSPNYLKIQPAIANCASVWKEASLVVVLDIINGLSARLPSTNGGEITEDSFTGNFVNKIWLIVIFYHGNLFLDEKSLLLKIMT